MQHLQKTGGRGVLWLTRHPKKGVCPESAAAEEPRDLSCHSARKHHSMNSFVFMRLRTLFRDGNPVDLFFSIASAFFPSPRGVQGTSSIVREAPCGFDPAKTDHSFGSTGHGTRDTGHESPPRSPATISHPWLANASASISSPISTGAKRLPAPFASLRIPPCPSRRMANTAGSKLAQDTAK